MWKIHRYYLREVTVSTILTFSVLFGIVMIGFVSRGIDRSQGGNLFDAMLITFYFTADAFPHLLSMSLLFASALTFARASQEREITAIRGAGISPRVPMVAVLLVGLFFSLVGSYTQHYVIPWAHFNKYRVVADIARNLFLNTDMSGDKIVFGNFVMSWESKDAGGHFRNVIVKRGRGRGLRSSSANIAEIGEVFEADEAWLEHEPGSVELTLKLRDLRDAVGMRVERMDFIVNIREITEQGRRTDGDKDVRSDQLLGEVERGVHHNPSGARFTIHRRACFALIPFLFAPLGFCIGVFTRDRGRVTALLLSMIPLLLFYVSDVLSPQIARLTQWPVVAWFPAFMITVLGVPFCWRLLRL